MENSSNVSEMLHDEINIMFTDWPMTKDMVIKGTPPSSFFNCIIIVFFSISMYILYYKLIYFNISKLTFYVFITEMAEYTRIQQKEEEEQDMVIQNIFEQELKPLEEDQDINEFITELFNENNTLPKCELDQWLEDYLEEMEIQQQKEGEQSQEVSDENNISSLLDMCHYSDISSVEDENSPSSGQCEENKDEKEQDKNNGDIFFNSCNCIFCSRSIIYEQEEAEEEEEEVLVGDDDLNVNVFNFPSDFFILNYKEQNLLNISKMK